MTNKEKITQILLNYAKKNQIRANIVVLELYAEELIKHGLTIVPTHCQNCVHLTDDGFCYMDVEGVGYKKTHDDGFCDKGEKGINES